MCAHPSNAALLSSSACTSICPLACRACQSRGPGGLPPPQLNHFALSLAPPAELPCLVQLLSPLPSTFGDVFLPFLLSQSKLFSFPLCLHCSQGQARTWPHPGGVRHGAGSWHSPAWSPILCLAAGCRAGMLPTGQLLLWVNYLCWALFILLLHSFFVFISLQYSQLEYPNENVKVRNHKHTV